MKGYANRYTLFVLESAFLTALIFYRFIIWSYANGPLNFYFSILPPIPVILEEFQEFQKNLICS